MSSITSQNRRHGTDGGFTLVEALVYAAGMVLIVGAISAFIFYMYQWYAAATVSTRVDQTAMTLISKLEDDLRDGSTIDAGQSAFDTAQGSIAIVSTVGSVSTTTAYALSGGRVSWKLNSGSAVYLTPPDLYVSGFYLHEITTPNSTAVRFEIDMAYQTKSGTTTNVYDGLAILRQSYQ